MTEVRFHVPPDVARLDEPRDRSLLGVVAVLRRERRLVLAVTLVGMLISLGVALFRPPTYTTTFSFLPQNAPDASRSGLLNLAGQFGVSLGALGGGGESPQLYADLLVTREVLLPIARDTVTVDATGSRKLLAEFLRAGREARPDVIDRTLYKLRTDVIATNVAARSTGMVTVAVRTKSPYVSLYLAARLVDGLNRFNLVTRQSQAREERRFTERRYNDARAALRSAEDALQEFLQANRQWEASPQLTFAHDRLQRDVRFQDQLVNTLAQQLEEVRIREVRDTPVITLIDRPALPARPDPRGRALIIILGAFVALGLGMLAALLRDAVRRQGGLGTLGAP